jgi:hypothetical protein
MYSNLSFSTVLYCILYFNLVLQYYTVLYFNLDNSSTVLYSIYVYTVLLYTLNE